MTGNANWLSTKDAAAELGLVGRTLYRYINIGDLPAYRFGRVIRIKRTDLDEFIRTSQIQPGEISHLDPGGPTPTDVDDPDEKDGGDDRF